MRRALFIFALAVAARAQSNTVIQKLITNSAGTGAGIIITSPVNNIGQTGHSVYTQMSNAPAKTCTATFIKAQLEFSFDGTNYNYFGSPNNTTGDLGTISVTGYTSFTFAGSGLFNYVRFHVYEFDNVNCRVSAWYTGTITTSPLPVIGQGSISGSPNGVAPLVVCDRVDHLHVAAVSTDLFPNIPVATPIRVCSVVASITGASTGAIKFCGSNNAIIGCDLALTAPINMSASQPLVWGGGLGQLFQSAYPVLVVVTTGAGAAADVTVTYTTGQ
jgi:hypothetical protein